MMLTCAMSTACAGMTPQLSATDVEALSAISDRSQREAAYAENQLYTHHQPQGIRYTKGTDPEAVKRSWQSLDAVLRSDANSAAALPDKKLRTSRVLATLAVATGLVAVSGFAASSAEGLDVSRLDGAGGMLLAGGVATLALAIASGITYNRARTDYVRAVEIYNDSLGMRMGLYTPSGQYIPADNVLVDEDGFIVLDSPELQYLDRPVTQPAPVPTRPPAAQPDGSSPHVGPDVPQPVGPAVAPSPAATPQPTTPQSTTQPQQPSTTQPPSTTPPQPSTQPQPTTPPQPAPKPAAPVQRPTSTSTPNALTSATPLRLLHRH